jgi:hypothetical protein
MNSKTIFSLAGFLLVAGAALPAQAEPPKHESHCPAGWNLIRVSKAKDQEKARQVDKNNDQYVCEKSTQNNLDYSDNKVKTENK